MERVIIRQMYHVVLIDDEDWSLESLINLVEWESFGYEIVKTFTDSELAFEYILNAKPDLVLTDIRMPALSGLELMKKTCEHGFQDIFFVVISGYGEFEYVQEALHLGAYDYCLKPMDAIKLEQLLSGLRKKLDEAKVLCDSILYTRLLIPSSDPVSLLSKYGFVQTGDYWQIFMLLDRSEEAAQMPLMDLPEPGCLLLHLDAKKMVLIFNEARDIEEHAIELLCSYSLDKRFLIGCSHISKKPESLAPLIHEAEIAACQYFIDTDYRCGLIRFENSSLKIVKVFVANIRSLLAEKDYEGAADAIDKIPELLKDNNLNMLHTVSIFNEIISVFAHSFDNEVAKAYYMNCTQLVETFPSCKAMSEFLKSIIIMNSDTQKGFDEDNIYINMNFRKLLHYVDENYMKQLSLKELARRYFIGFSYCCFLFKKKTNKTFKEYLEDKRMEMAYCMLQSGEHTVSQVSSQVGYSDQYYFCKRFKKYFGLAPSRIIRNS